MRCSQGNLPLFVSLNMYACTCTCIHVYRITFVWKKQFSRVPSRSLKKRSFYKRSIPCGTKCCPRWIICGSAIFFFWILEELGCNCERLSQFWELFFFYKVKERIILKTTIFLILFNSACSCGKFFFWRK